MADDWRQPLQGASAFGRCTRWQSRNELHKRVLNTKLHVAVDAHGMPLRALVTKGTAADCSQATALIVGFAAHALLAD